MRCKAVHFSHDFGPNDCAFDAGHEGLHRGDKRGWPWWSDHQYGVLSHEEVLLHEYGTWLRYRESLR